MLNIRTIKYYICKLLKSRIKNVLSIIILELCIGPQVREFIVASCINNLLLNRNFVSLSLKKYRNHCFANITGQVRT